jgi:hypothetical protein
MILHIFSEWWQWRIQEFLKGGADSVQTQYFFRKLLKISIKSVPKEGAAALPWICPWWVDMWVLECTLKKKVLYRTPKKVFGDLKKRPNALKCLKNDSSDLQNL